MSNIIGPFGAGINQTTARPVDAPSGLAQDTWFQPCVGSDPTTGTKIPSLWLNKVSALLRNAIRGRGIADAETDDTMLLRAINSADRGLVNVGSGAPVFDGITTDGHYGLRNLAAGAGITLVPDDGNGNIVIETSAAPVGQVNADWAAATGVAAILNKPVIPAAQVQADWTATAGVTEILNKPVIPTDLIPIGLARITTGISGSSLVATVISSSGVITGASVTHGYSDGTAITTQVRVTFTAATLKGYVAQAAGSLLGSPPVYVDVGVVAVNAASIDVFLQINHEFTVAIF